VTRQVVGDVEKKEKNNKQRKAKQDQKVQTTRRFIPEAITDPIAPSSVRRIPRT
jgi:hypothetical protein